VSDTALSPSGQCLPYLHQRGKCEVTQYDKYWWNKYEQHGDSMLQMVLIQSLKEHNQCPNMCEDQEPETQLNTTSVAVIDSLQLRKNQIQDLADSAAMRSWTQMY
jgi:hypothetical protein